MKLSKPITFIRLSKGYPSRSKMISPNAAAEAIGAKTARTRSSVQLFEDKALSPITTHDSQTESQLRLRFGITLPTERTYKNRDGQEVTRRMKGSDLFRGMIIVRADQSAEAERWLDDRAETRRNLVADFATGAYRAQIETARNQLGDAFDPADYPDEFSLIESFTYDYQSVCIESSDSTDEAIRDRNRAKLESQYAEVAAEARIALREGLADMTAKLVDVLTPDADGKRKKLYDSAVDNLRIFLDAIDRKDLTSDADLIALRDKARAVIGQTTADTLRDSPTAAARFRDGLATIAANAAALVKTEGERAFCLED